MVRGISLLFYPGLVAFSLLILCRYVHSPLWINYCAGAAPRTPYGPLGVTPGGAGGARRSQEEPLGVPRVPLRAPRDSYGPCGPTRLSRQLKQGSFKLIL